MTTEIAWGDGSNDKIRLTYDAPDGNRNVAVSSDANTGPARTKTITFSAGNVSKILTVSQESGETPGGRITDYVQNGLVLHLDGKTGKTGDESWKSVVGNVLFINHGAIFNADNIYFDGTNDYLSNTTFETPLSSTGTIEICFEREGTGTRVIYMPKTDKALSFGCIGNVLNWSNGVNRRTYSTLPTKGVASVNINGAIQNGEAMTAQGNTYMSGRSATNTYIGRRSTGNYFMGKIYSIRIYNRTLTEAEILQNQSVDNIRFNLGLTL